MRRLLPILALLAATPAEAQTVSDVERAWRDWMGRNGRTAGALAIVRRGKFVHEATLGSVAAGARLPLASLSKAITAVCVAGLVERGTLAFDTPLSQALARSFGRLGAPADARLKDVTLTQLLTHRAGYDRAEDPAIGPSLAAYLGYATARNTAFDERLRALWRQKLPLQPGARYAYSNATYLLLGAVVEEASGRDYEGFCRQSVLAPLGASSAELDPAWRVLSSFGGWRMSLADYGRFYQAFAPASPAIGPAARRWMMDPEGKAVGGGVHYGLGTNVRPLAGGDANFWHMGSWTYRLTGAFDGPLVASYATSAVRWGALDVNVATYMEPVADGASRGELDRVLGEAVRAVTRWP